MSEVQRREDPEVGSKKTIRENKWGASKTHWRGNLISCPTAELVKLQAPPPNTGPSSQSSHLSILDPHWLLTSAAAVLGPAAPAHFLTCWSWAHSSCCCQHLLMWLGLQWIPVSSSTRPTVPVDASCHWAWDNSQWPTVPQHSAASLSWNVLSVLAHITELPYIWGNWTLPCFGYIRFFAHPGRPPSVNKNLFSLLGDLIYRFSYPQITQPHMANSI